MGVFLIDGFEHDDLSTNWTDRSSYINRSTNTPYGSGYSVGNTTAPSYLTAPQYMRRYIPSSSAPLYLGMAFRGPIEIFLHSSSSRAGATPGVLFVGFGNGDATVRNAFTTQFETFRRSFSGFNVAPQWNYLEIRFPHHSESPGRWIVKNYGKTLLDDYGETSRHGSYALSVMDVGLPPESRIDDLYLADDGLIGEVRVVGIAPTGAGSEADFDPFGSANNWENVIPGNTGYNASAVVGDRDLYQMSDIDTDVEVLGVQQTAVARKTDVLAPDLRSVLQTNSAVHQSALWTPGASNQVRNEMHLLNPVTGVAWTTSEVNALQLGMEIGE